MGSFQTHEKMVVTGSLPGFRLGPRGSQTWYRWEVSRLAFGKGSCRRRSGHLLVCVVLGPKLEDPPLRRSGSVRDQAML